MKHKSIDLLLFMAIIHVSDKDPLFEKRQTLTMPFFAYDEQQAEDIFQSMIETWGMLGKHAVWGDYYQQTPPF